MVNTLDAVESRYVQTQRVSTNTLDTVKSGVTVICVPPGNVRPRTPFPGDISSPNNYHWGQKFLLAKALVTHIVIHVSVIKVYGYGTDDMQTTTSATQHQQIQHISAPLKRPQDTMKTMHYAYPLLKSVK